MPRLFNKAVWVPDNADGTYKNPIIDADFYIFYGDPYFGIYMVKARKPAARGQNRCL